jgi:hypothetical protein
LICVRPQGSVLCRPPSDWHNNGRQCPPLAVSTPSLATVEVGRLLLNYVLLDPYVDVALVGVRKPRFVALNNEISDDVAARIDLAALHDRYVR